MRLDEKQLVQIAAKMAANIEKFYNKNKGLVVFLYGDLGAGKTTFVRAFLQSFDLQIKVKSPTYTLVEPYSILVKDFENVNINKQLSVYHFDLYRLIDSLELYDIGIEEYLSKGVSFIEWPNKGEEVLPDPDIEIKIEHAGDEREVSIFSHQPLYQEQINKLFS